MQIIDKVKQRANINDSLETNLSNRSEQLYLQAANDLNQQEDNNSDDSDDEDENKESESDEVVILQEVQEEIEQENGDD